VFVDWINSSPETRGYLSSSSDIAALLVFDHQMHAINLLTRLNWEARVESADEHATAVNGPVRRLANELADYLLFVDEARLSVPLTARPGFAERLASRVPQDHRGRSFGQLDLITRLLKYPCSYMVYSAAFDALPPAIKTAVYGRIIERAPAADRNAILEILRDTKPDFPRQ
jgi:hypothetical protein